MHFVVKLSYMSYKTYKYIVNIASHARGQRFESVRVHHKNHVVTRFVAFAAWFLFFFVLRIVVKNIGLS